MLLCLCLPNRPGLAQTTPPPALVADLIRYDAASDSLIASGDVQVFFEGRVLSARRITYLNAEGEILIDGPMVLRDASGAALLAEGAQLDAALADGLLYGARLVLAENFQFAAAEAQRTAGRYTSLKRTVASACKICNRDDIPVWLIRADRIVHDDVERVVHYDGARFELLGIPVAYFPYFRTPDPGVRRASGFLSPRFRNSDIFGFGLQLPYYIVLDDHRDITLTPFLTTKGANLLEAEYRQRFTGGELDATGALAIDDNPALPRTRAFLGVDAAFRLKRDQVVELDVNWASDNAFLNEYGFSSADRLTTSATLSRQTDTSYFRTEAVAFQSLLDGVNDAALPIVLPRVSYDRYWDETVFDGRIDVSADFLALARFTGRDVFSAGASLGWQADRILPGGIVGSALARVEGRAYSVTGDQAYAPGTFGVIRPAAALDLRWPFARQDGESVMVLEPVLQLVYSDSLGDESRIPNEDSQQLEFDAGNLFSIDRFPGNDRSESGLRANAGVTLKRIAKSGWTYSATLGQVFRRSRSSDYPTATGLNDTSSNLVAASNVEFPPYFSLANQTILSNSLSFERNDIQLGLDLDRFDLDLAYVFLAPDPGSGSASPRQEIAVDTRYRVSDNWAVDLDWRHDLATGTNVSAGAGLEYGNECIRSRFSVSRRYTNSNSLPSSTEFGFTVSLAGLGGSTEKWPAHACTAR